ncbi:hypothetical protein [Serratia fonticola]|uniref:hypothetical protein n=1 Tax=Serratia fonticola TaxID=47917 RepID=UPI000E2B411E|nr:hypothetical protein [Serratia fonticola]RDL12904.1 hypothetical protein DFO62_1443 [Serratia fonticola]
MTTFEDVRIFDGSHLTARMNVVVEDKEITQISSQQIRVIEHGQLPMALGKPEQRKFFPERIMLIGWQKIRRKSCIWHRFFI